jgi:hypothetical protein
MHRVCLVLVCLLTCILQGWQLCVDGVKDLMEKEGNLAVAEQCAAVVSVTSVVGGVGGCGQHWLVYEGGGRVGWRRRETMQWQSSAQRW